MKLKNLPGEFAFRALVRRVGWGGDAQWRLSDAVYFSKEDTQKMFLAGDGFEIKWPIEIYEDGTVYCPAAEELEDEAFEALRPNL